jgi:hypothetical protein
MTRSTVSSALRGPRRTFRRRSSSVEAAKLVASHPRRCREYAEHYFGDEPLGFRAENGFEQAQVVGDLIIPAAKPVDALLRSVPAVSPASARD